MMKRISFNNRSYLRNGVQRIEIEDENLKFINGLAIAKAKVHCATLEKNYSFYKPKVFTYFCEGLVNENYEEAFFAKYENEQSKYLMFCEKNKKIVRFGTNDYIVERLEKIQGKLEKRYTHLKVIDGKIFMIKENIKDFSLTFMEDIAILNHQFYIVSVGKFFGPKFLFLKEDPNKVGEFIVMDKIAISGENEFPVYDVLTYRIDNHLKLTSFVYSLIEGNSPLFIDSTDSHKIREERIETLKKKKWQFLQALPDSLAVNKLSITSIPSLFIRENQFFSSSTAKPFGPEFIYLKEDSNKAGEFIVIDKIVVSTLNKKNNFPIVDVLTFRMNKDFQVLSTPVSLLEEGSLYFSTNQYEKIREERTKELIEKRDAFFEKMDSLANAFNCENLHR